MIPYIDSFKAHLQELQDRVWIWKRDENIKQDIVDAMQVSIDFLRTNAEDLPNRLIKKP